MGGFPSASVVKNPHAMQEMWVQSLGQEDLLEKEMATQYSCLEIPMDRGAWWAMVHGVAKELHTTERLNNKDLPGGLVVKSALPTQGVQVQSLVGELRSHMLCGAAKIFIWASHEAQ